MASKLYVLLVIVFFLLSIPLNTVGMDFNIEQFIGPKPGYKNTYSCDFPCKKIEIAGKKETEREGVEISEKMYFSDEFLKENPDMPEFTSSIYRIYKESNKLIKSTGNNSNIFLQTSLTEDAIWEFMGKQVVVSDQQPISKLKSADISWECRIINIGKKILFEKNRGIVSVRCLPKFLPGETLFWKYASGIGLIEYKTGYKMENGELSEMTIMSIMNHKQN